MATLFNLSSVKTLALPLAIAAVTVFSGCATTASPEARSAYDKTQQNLKSQPVSIISDGCVLLIEMGQDNILYQQSDALSNMLASTLKTKLSAKGVTTQHTSSPFICGALTQVELAQMDMVATVDAKDLPNTDFPVLSTSNTFDTLTNQAYLNLYSSLVAVNKAAGENKNTGANTTLNLDKVSLQTIRKIEGTDKVFVITGSANKQSMGLRLVVASTSPTIGGLINRAPGKIYSVYLINLKTSQVEWTKSGRIDSETFKEAVTGAIVTRDEMLDPLYPE